MTLLCDRAVKFARWQRRLFIVLSGVYINEVHQR